MATAKQKAAAKNAAKKTARAQPVDPRGSSEDATTPSSEDPKVNALLQATHHDEAGSLLPRAVKKRKDGDDLVSVTVPKAFKLTDDDGTLHVYEQGYQDMRESHASHWFAKAQGVEINEKTKK